MSTQPPENPPPAPPQPEPTHTPPPVPANAPAPPPVHDPPPSHVSREEFSGLAENVTKLTETVTRLLEGLKPEDESPVKVPFLLRGQKVPK